MAGKLTDKQLKAIVHTEKTQTFSDGESLFLEVTPKGAKYWRFRYRIGGRPEKRKNARAALTDPKDIGTMLRAIDS